MMIANRHFAVVPWRYADQNLGVSLLSARRPCESKPSSPARVLDAAISRWNGVTGNFSTAPLAAVLIWSKVSTSKHILGTWELHCQTSKHLLRRFVHLSHHLLFKHSYIQLIFAKRLWILMAAAFLLVTSCPQGDGPVPGNPQRNHPCASKQLSTMLRTESNAILVFTMARCFSAWWLWIKWQSWSRSTKGKRVILHV